MTIRDYALLPHISNKLIPGEVPIGCQLPDTGLIGFGWFGARGEE